MQNQFQRGDLRQKVSHQGQTPWSGLNAVLLILYGLLKPIYFSLSVFCIGSEKNIFFDWTISAV